MSVSPALGAFQMAASGWAARMCDERFEVPAQWRLLEQALAQPLALRDESSNRPLVYGYIRAATSQPGHVDACRRTLDRYCRRENLALCGVFTDQGVRPDQMVRPGLAGLCQTLCLPDSFAAVMVRPAHLSTDGRVAQQLAEHVRKTGARLLFVHPSATTAVLPLWWQ